MTELSSTLFLIFFTDRPQRINFVHHLTSRHCSDRIQH